MTEQPSQRRRSTHLSTKEIVFYGLTLKRNEFFVYDTADRTVDAPFRCRAKWWGYKAPAADTWETRRSLVWGGFVGLVCFIDCFKSWQRNAQDGECERTLADFKKHVKFPRTFTADDDRLCYAESLRTVANLLGIEDYLLQELLNKFWTKHPSTKEGGVGWQDLTKLVQLCNVFQKKNGKRITFGDAKEQVNRIRETLSGHIDLETFKLTAGVYLCGVSATNSGHMFVLFVKNGIIVFGSMQRNPHAFSQADFSWVVR